MTAAVRSAVCCPGDAEAGGTEVVGAGLQDHTLPQGVEADLALEVLQGGLLSRGVAAGCSAEDGHRRRPHTTTGAAQGQQHKQTGGQAVMIAAATCKWP